MQTDSGEWWKPGFQKLTLDAPPSGASYIFLSLPGELRSQIYLHLYPPHSPELIPNSTALSLSFLLTCRLIYYECREYAYRHVFWHIQKNPNAKRETTPNILRKRGCLLTPSSRQLLTRISMPHRLMNNCEHFSLGKLRPLGLFPNVTTVTVHGHQGDRFMCCTDHAAKLFPKLERVFCAIWFFPGRDEGIGEATLWRNVSWLLSNTKNFMALGGLKLLHAAGEMIESGDPKPWRPRYFIEDYEKPIVGGRVCLHFDYADEHQALGFPPSKHVYVHISDAVSASKVFAEYHLDKCNLCLHDMGAVNIRTIKRQTDVLPNRPAHLPPPPAHCNGPLHRTSAQDR